MNGMGDIRFDEHALLRALGPQVDSLATGALHRAALAVPADAVTELIAWEDSRFEIDPRLSRDEREDHARMQLGIEQVLRGAATGPTPRTSGPSPRTAVSRVCRSAAASSLMAKGYGYGAEGDALTAALMAAAQTLLGVDAVHRDVRDGLPERLHPDESHGRGQLAPRS